VLEHLDRLFFALSKREAKESVGSSLLGGLLLQDILEQVFIPLNQPLTVLLTMLDLFLTVALDAFQQ